ncbi:MAG: amidohydrolase family protein, partial [Planctomycetia bacterium]|nr:amidohydrolase family protein [Planctomycetia bacterium]
DVKQQLIEYMQGLEIIDCHEHLTPEKKRIEREVDVLTLVSLYAWFDTVSAGLPAEGIAAGLDNYFLDTSVPLDERWKTVWPYLQHIKFGSYFRATAITLRDIYGIDDLNEGTYREASERMRAANKPGLYRKIFRERCNIKTCLVQNEAKPEDQKPADLLTPVVSIKGCYDDPKSFADFLGKEYDTSIGDLDTYLDLLERYLTYRHERGDKGFKTSAQAFPEPDAKVAASAFADALNGAPATPVLKATILDAALNKAAEWDWPVPVHCGIWNDFRKIDPKNVIDMVQRYPDVRFDLYHLGMPFARDCIFIAKNFANAYLNLCWCYVISQEITRRTISEILDTVPVNKVFGYGGDYIWAVENVYGHLVMARETMAEALSERIRKGKLDLDGARHIAKLWLHDNPSRFYGLE